MTLFLKRVNRRPEHEGGLLDPGFWKSFSSGGRGRGARWLQDRKFGRKESTRMKTDLTDPQMISLIRDFQVVKSLHLKFCCWVVFV